MKRTFILPAILALGIALSTPKVEAINWSAKAGLWGAATLISASQAIGGVLVYLFPKETRDNIEIPFTANIQCPEAAKIHFLKKSGAGIAVGFGLLTAFCANKFYNTIK